MGLFAKVGDSIECLRKLQDAPIAQIKGGFINWTWYICERRRIKIVCLRKLQDAPIAQIKGGFINWIGIICESGARVKNAMCVCLFLEKTEHIYYVDSFKLFFDIFIM
jgi:hypothetical protein